MAEEIRAANVWKVMIKGSCTVESDKSPCSCL